MSNPKSSLEKDLQKMQENLWRTKIETLLGARTEFKETQNKNKALNKEFMSILSDERIRQLLFNSNPNDIRDNIDRDQWYGPNNPDRVTFYGASQRQLVWVNAKIANLPALLNVNNNNGTAIQNALAAHNHNSEDADKIMRLRKIVLEAISNNLNIAQQYAAIDIKETRRINEEYKSKRNGGVHDNNVDIEILKREIEDIRAAAMAKCHKKSASHNTNLKLGRLVQGGPPDNKENRNPIPTQNTVSRKQNASSKTDSQTTHLDKASSDEKPLPASFLHVDKIYQYALADANVTLEALKVAKLGFEVLTLNPKVEMPIIRDIQEWVKPHSISEDVRSKTTFKNK